MVVQRAIVNNAIVIRNVVVRAQDGDDGRGVGRLAIGVGLGVHGARHGSHTGDVVIQAAGEVVHKPAAVGIPHGVNAGEVHTMKRVHLVNQGRYKIDVAVRIRDRER